MGKTHLRINFPNPYFSSIFQQPSSSFSRVSDARRFYIKYTKPRLNVTCIVVYLYLYRTFQHCSWTIYDHPHSTSRQPTVSVHYIPHNNSLCTLARLVIYHFVINSNIADEIHIRASPRVSRNPAPNPHRKFRLHKQRSESQPNPTYVDICFESFLLPIVSLESVVLVQ